MTLIPSATPDVMPLKFPSGLRLTPEQFKLVCAENRELLFQLQQYAKASGDWKVFESSGGFRLPDASLVRLDRWRALSADEHRGFAPLCPGLVVELAIQRFSPLPPNSPA